MICFMNIFSFLSTSPIDADIVAKATALHRLFNQLSQSVGSNSSKKTLALYRSQWLCFSHQTLTATSIEVHFFFSIWLSSHPRTICERLFFPRWIALEFLSKSSDHLHEYLLLGPLSSSLIYFSISSLVPHCLDCYNLMVNLKVPILFWVRRSLSNIENIVGLQYSCYLSSVCRFSKDKNIKRICEHLKITLSLINQNANCRYLKISQLCPDGHASSSWRRGHQPLMYFSAIGIVAMNSGEIPIRVDFFLPGR